MVVALAAETSPESSHPVTVSGTLTTEKSLCPSLQLVASEESVSPLSPVQGLGVPAGGSDAKGAGVGTEESYPFTSLSAIHKCILCKDRRTLSAAHSSLVNSGYYVTSLSLRFLTYKMGVI